MRKKTVDRVLELVASSSDIHTVDITGGAPELNPSFRDLVQGVKQMGKKVMDRCNLTVLLEPGQEETSGFLCDHQVKVISSLPCYSQDNVDKQRGRGVFKKSIQALQQLNDLGYGKPGTGLEIDLVYNPVGACLPPNQAELEASYREQLKRQFNVEFNKLLTMTNMPINRFLKYLEHEGLYEDYMNLLIQQFNANAALGVMCTEMVSVSWDGFIYDCDFNQMLELSSNGGRQSIWNIGSFEELNNLEIIFGNHCYGCTAGAGSSCGGRLLKNEK